MRIADVGLVRVVVGLERSRRSEIGANRVCVKIVTVDWDCWINCHDLHPPCSGCQFSVAACTRSAIPGLRQLFAVLGVGCSGKRHISPRLFRHGERNGLWPSC